MIYYVNNKADNKGNHEVHTSTCKYLPTDRKYLGDFSNCTDAVKEAKKTYPNSDGCYYCSNACHTK
ncbi:MAG: hypothetical protein EAZ85_15860 [Bacteroidetes bacterium]|nr:MAG: hypothetical protein EAZ85_15860 [Bacteroidota bacterium]TAG89732.1 MAG: hypothetical protein EAZ20_05820 [Bacteroidota bacterium]